MSAAKACLLLAALLVPSLSFAGEDPPPGPVDPLKAEVVPVTSLDLGGVSLRLTNCFSVRLTWSEAPLLDYNSWEGYYGVEADWGDGWRTMPFSFWDHRSLTYDWAVDAGDHRDGITGRTWELKVGAFRSNASADGPKANVSAYVPGKLGGSTGLTAQRSGGGVKLSWTAPAGRAGTQGGPPVSVDKYVVTRLDETEDGLKENIIGEASGTEFTDTRQIAASDHPTYLLYAVDKFGLGSSTSVYLPEEEDEPAPSLGGCAAAPSRSAPLGTLLWVLAAFARRRLQSEG